MNLEICVHSRCKNHFGGQFLYIILDPSKKRRYIATKNAPFCESINSWINYAIFVRIIICFILPFCLCCLGLSEIIGQIKGFNKVHFGHHPAQHLSRSDLKFLIDAVVSRKHLKLLFLKVWSFSIELLKLIFREKLRWSVLIH